MEVTTARAFDGQRTTLADSVNAYIEANGITKAALAREISYSRSAVSQYLSGKYESNPEEIEGKLNAYMQRVANGEGVSARIGMFLSRDAQSVLGVCDSSQNEAGLGIVVGKSGYGKTYTLREYAKRRHAVYIECDDGMGRWDVVELLQRKLGLPRISGSIWKRINAIRDFLNANPGYLLIIDEADKLISRNTQKKMELLRGIYDQADVGIVIAGEPKLESMIREYLDRMANRIDFYACLGGLTEREVNDYLAGYVVDADARTELMKRAQGENGCFRLFDRTLRNCLRVMNAHDTQRLSLEIIHEASRMMLL